MRNLNKQPCPSVLIEKAAMWLRRYLSAPESPSHRYRYRHPDIKSVLRKETHGKCVYCESKLGHNTPGDVEHRLPVSVFPHSIFCWTNLTLACTECNRRKGTYYDQTCPFLDPYSDDVESLVVHLGPIVGWRSGSSRAEITVRLLELNSYARHDLVVRKIEKISDVSHLMDRCAIERHPVLRALLEQELRLMMDPASEFSAMVKSIVTTKHTTGPISSSSGPMPTGTN